MSGENFCAYSRGRAPPGILDAATGSEALRRTAAEQKAFAGCRSPSGTLIRARDCRLAAGTGLMRSMRPAASALAKLRRGSSIGGRPSPGQSPPAARGLQCSREGDDAQRLASSATRYAWMARRARDDAGDEKKRSHSNACHGTCARPPVRRSAAAAWRPATSWCSRCCHRPLCEMTDCSSRRLCCWRFFSAHTAALRGATFQLPARATWRLPR